MTLVLKQVDESDVRPAGPPGFCFYCNQPVGGTHALNCVSVRRKVKIRVTTVYEITMPQHWGKEEIEFNLNEGSRCANSTLDHLLKLYDGVNGCACGHIHHEYLGDA